MRPEHCAKELTRPEVGQDPYPFYVRLRRDDPVHRCADGLLVSRAADVTRVLADHETFSSDVRRGGQPEGPVRRQPMFDVFAAVSSQLIQASDPLDHTRLRRGEPRLHPARRGEGES